MQVSIPQVLNLENLGGHLKPDPLSRAASVLETHGKAVAEHVATFEARQVDAIKELVQRENCDCDFEETRVTDVCFYEAGRDKIKADLAKIAKADISTAKGITFTSDSEAEEVCTMFGGENLHMPRANPLKPLFLQDLTKLI
jgi:hypothetical protein